MFEEGVKKLITLCYQAWSRKVLALDFFMMFFLGGVASFFYQAKEVLPQEVMLSWTLLELVVIVNYLGIWGFLRGVHKLSDPKNIKEFFFLLLKKRTQSLFVYGSFLSVALSFFWVIWIVSIYIPYQIDLHSDTGLLKLVCQIAPVIGYLTILVQLILSFVFVFVSLPYLVKKDVTFLDVCLYSLDRFRSKRYKIISHVVLSFLPLLFVFCLLKIFYIVFPLQSNFLWSLVFEPLMYSFSMLVFLELSLNQD